MLATFAKTPLIKAGASVTVHLSLPLSALSAYDSKTKTQKVEAGEYVLSLGEDSVSTIETLTVGVTA
jgi:hypothetical protein